VTVAQTVPVRIDANVENGARVTDADGTVAISVRERWRCNNPVTATAAISIVLAAIVVVDNGVALAVHRLLLLLRQCHAHAQGATAAATAHDYEYSAAGVANGHSEGRPHVSGKSLQFDL